MSEGETAPEIPVPAGEYPPPPPGVAGHRLSVHARAQLWARFASGAGAATPANAAAWADALLEEYEQRWPGEDPAPA